MTTYRITNFLGRNDRTGKRKKQITKQARAPRLQAPKIIIRSHLLTMTAQSQYFELHNWDKNEQAILTHSLQLVDNET